MKTRCLITIVAFITAIITNVNCKKDLPTSPGGNTPSQQATPESPTPTSPTPTTPTPTTPTPTTPPLPTPMPPTPPPTPPVPPVNTPPVVNAGPDQETYVPASQSNLKGSATDQENNIAITSWRKIAGPGGGEIQNPNMLETVVGNLVPGTYQYELTVRDRGGLEAMDICQIIVKPFIPTGETIIFPNRTWIFPWYNAIEIENFRQLNPSERPFILSIKRDNQTIWNIVTPLNIVSTAEYEYFIETRPDGAGMYTYGSLYIFYYGTDVSDTPDIKVEF